MSTHTAIEWTDHTFNPWIGCTKVSPGCANCYAETLMDTRYGRVKWGPGQPRSRTSAENWKLPLGWERAAARDEHEFASTGKVTNDDGAEIAWHRPRVFCASLADWLDEEVPIEWLVDLLDLIRRTPHLDWQLLTKRPQNWRQRLEKALVYSMMPAPIAADDAREADRLSRHAFAVWLRQWVILRMPPPYIWVGTTVEDQSRAEERIPALLEIPALVRFLSCEPLLGPLNLDFGHPRFRTFVSYHAEVDWVICGGESGPGARPMHPDWARSLRDQCAASGVPYFFKQWGQWLPQGQVMESQSASRVLREGRELAGAYVVSVGKKAAGRLLDGREHSAFPEVLA